MAGPYKEVSLNMRGGKKKVANRWYWVDDGAYIFPAMYDPGAEGGWRNNDTWQDFDGEVKRWVIIPGPVWESPKRA